MAKMKSRTTFPPGEWQVLIPEAGMKEPFHGGFDEAVGWLLSFVKKNPALAQRLNLPSNYTDAANYVDDYNARRLLSGGFLSFVDLETALPVAIEQAQKKTSLGRAAVGVVKKGRAALSAYGAMFGSIGPVGKDIAQARADVCASCPQNDTTSSLYSVFAEGAASQLMSILGALRDLDLTVSNANKLGVCNACSCPMGAKVFVPLNVLVEKMPAESWEALSRNPLCWILKESGKQ